MLEALLKKQSKANQRDTEKQFQQCLNLSINYLLHYPEQKDTQKNN